MLKVLSLEQWNSSKTARVRKKWVVRGKQVAGPDVVSSCESWFRRLHLFKVSGEPLETLSWWLTQLLSLRLLSEEYIKWKARAESRNTNGAIDAFQPVTVVLNQDSKMLTNISVLNTVKTQVAMQVNLLQGEEEYERQKEKRWFQRLWLGKWGWRSYWLRC